MSQSSYLAKLNFFLFLLICSAVQSKFYEVRSRTSLMREVNIAPIAVVCLHDYARASLQARALFGLMQRASTYECYHFIKIPFVMMNVADDLAITKLFSLSMLPAIKLFVSGKPLDGVLSPVCSSAHIIQFIDQHVGDYIVQIAAQQKAFQREMQLHAIKAWGFYAPYAYP